MEQLIAEVSKRTGLPEAQARQAAEAVLEFLKKKLPSAMAAHLDGAVSGDGGGGLGGLAGGLGGMFSK